MIPKNGRFMRDTPNNMINMDDLDYREGMAFLATRQTHMEAKWSHAQAGGFNFQRLKPHLGSSWSSQISGV